MTALRAGLKATVERGLVSSGLPAAVRRGRRDGTLILAYHNVVPEGASADGERSLHLPVAAFREQLDSLRETHDVVSLDSILDGRPARRRPRAVITFDDAYRGAVTCGIDEIVARGMPATIFVAPAFIGDRSFWWDALTPAGAADLSDDFRARALDTYRGDDHAVRRWAEESSLTSRSMPSHARCASEAELRAAAANPGIAVASHSWSHPNLCRLSASELAAELARPMAWLLERFDSVLPVVSYPYGLSSSPVARAAAEAGYRAGVCIGGGWVTTRQRDAFALPRLNIPAGLSPMGFVIRTAGLVAR